MRTDRHMAKIIVAFRDFANVPTKSLVFLLKIFDFLIPCVGKKYKKNIFFLRYEFVIHFDVLLLMKVLYALPVGTGGRKHSTHTHTHTHTHAHAHAQ